MDGFTLLYFHGICNSRYFFPINYMLLFLDDDTTLFTFKQDHSIVSKWLYNTRTIRCTTLNPMPTHQQNDHENWSIGWSPLGNTIFQTINKYSNHYKDGMESSIHLQQTTSTTHQHSSHNHSPLMTSTLFWIHWLVRKTSWNSLDGVILVMFTINLITSRTCILIPLSSFLAFMFSAFFACLFLLGILWPHLIM